MEIQEQVGLAGFTTFGVGGAARYFVVARREQEVAEAVAWAEEKGVPLFVLGGGSNLLVGDGEYEGLVLRMAIGGIVKEGCRWDVGAGANWDGFVERAVDSGCQGVECLAGIPGSVGGTPVQNVGAYGQEVSETIESVRAFDRVAKEFVEIPKAECGFRYRESRFNTDEPGRFVVVRVRFVLREGGKPELKYADLKKWFGEHEPTLEEVAVAVRSIRASKGMLLVEGDVDCRSAGSFFKNPVVSSETVAGIAAAAGVESVPNWPAGEGMVKLPAAWLLEKAGFVKGYGDGPVGISSKHTLALVNRGGATAGDVERFERVVVETVMGKFGVGLVREPVRLGGREAVVSG